MLRSARSRFRHPFGHRPFLRLLHGMLAATVLLAMTLTSLAGCAPRTKPSASPDSVPPKLEAVQWTDKARRLWINGSYTDPVTANSHLTRALELSPDDPAILQARAVARLQLDDRTRAMDDLDHAARIAPDMVSVRSLRGRLHIEGRRFKAAAEDFAAVVAADPNNATAYGKLGMVRGILGQDQAALSAFDSALALDPSRDDLYFQRATTQVHLGDREAALRDLTEAISLQPRAPIYYTRRGRLLLYDLHLEAARRDFVAALDLAPANAEAHLGMAQLYACSPKKEDRDAALALEHAEAAIQHAAPATAEYFDALAAAQAENGNFAAAVATEEKALGLAREHEPASVPLLNAHLRLLLDGKPLRF